MPMSFPFYGTRQPRRTGTFLLHAQFEGFSTYFYTSVEEEVQECNF